MSANNLKILLLMRLVSLPLDSYCSGDVEEADEKAKVREMTRIMMTNICCS